MPSKSKAQQRFFGMVDAYKKGEMKNPSSKIKKAANGMSMSDVKDFAETKHKGLPEKVEEQTIIRLTESDLHKIVKESVNRILSEIGDTPRGNFALNAVKGRRAAKGYRTNMGIKDRAENSKMIGRADDEAWKGYKDSLNTPNPLRSHNNEAGYNYGFQKGVEKYQK